MNHRNTKLKAAKIFYDMLQEVDPIRALATVYELQITGLSTAVSAFEVMKHDLDTTSMRLILDNNKDSPLPDVFFEDLTNLHELLGEVAPIFTRLTNMLEENNSKC